MYAPIWLSHGSATGLGFSITNQLTAGFRVIDVNECSVAPQFSTALHFYLVVPIFTDFHDRPSCVPTSSAVILDAYT